MAGTKQASGGELRRSAGVRGGGDKVSPGLGQSPEWEGGGEGWMDGMGASEELWKPGEPFSR